MSNKIVRLTPKEFEKVKGYQNLDPKARALTVRSGDDYQILLPYKLPTRYKVHEVGHARLGHRKFPSSSPEEVLRNEVDAELFSYEAMDRNLTTPAIVDMVAMGRSFGLSTNESCKIVLDQLSKRGYPTTEKGLSTLLKVSKEVD